MEAGVKCLCRDTSCVSEARTQGETKSKYLPFPSCLFYHRTHWKLGLGESVELVFEVQLAEHRAGCILVRIVPQESDQPIYFPSLEMKCPVSPLKIA